MLYNLCVGRPLRLSFCNANFAILQDTLGACCYQNPGLLMQHFVPLVWRFLLEWFAKPSCRKIFISMFTEVGLNLAPLLHRDVPLETRCELGLSGFLCLDVFQMLSHDMDRTLNLPRGSSFWAPQTVLNLQSACLSGVLMTLTKDETFSPWTFGNCRLTELPVEEHFSFCRGQSSNSQLSCRAFWQASARVSMRTGKKLNEMKHATIKGEKPLTAGAFLGQTI